MSGCRGRFILEVRKKTGVDYPSQTLYEIVICIQQYLKMFGRDLKLLEDTHIPAIRHTLDNRMKELSSKGINCPRSQAQCISIDDENKMWEEGILGSGNPKQLIETLLFQFGLHFAL